MSIHAVLKHSQATDDVHWLSVSDLMAGLMMIFLFIAITYMRMVVLERDQIKEVIVAWDQTQDAVFEALESEFKDDLERWNAEIERESLTVRFKEPEVLFKRGKVDLQQKFKGILSEFFPRYLNRLSEFTDCEPREDGKPRGCIEEIRIEGHTSSEWNRTVTEEEGYFLNMWLSQGRTRSVLEYCYQLPESETYPWLKQKVSAVGYSSSHLVDKDGRPIDKNGVEDKDRSRRVEFRIKTTIEKQLMKIIQND